MRIIERIKSTIRRFFIKRAIKRIRREFGLLGYSLDDLSDEEIIVDVENMVKAMNTVSFIVEQASAALAVVAKQFRDFGEALHGKK